MSQQPQWITNAGSLGTIQESRFYKIPLLAIDPNFPTDPTKVTFKLIAGQMPAGLAVNTSGILSGVPIAEVDFKGVPIPVSKDTTSKFTIRATTSDNRIRDRTFTITITGQDVPKFITPAGTLGTYFTGENIDIQIEYNDKDITDTVRISVLDGTLPPGLTLTADGRIIGYVVPEVIDNSALIGWDKVDAEWDEYKWDFGITTSIVDVNVTYIFVLQLDDGKDVALRSFTIVIDNNSNDITADSTLITADSTLITADSSVYPIPYLLEIPDFGKVTHDNFFGYQFKGFDPMLTDITYTVYSGVLPPSLTLDPVTGWLYGDLEEIVEFEKQYNFSIRLVTANGRLSVIYNFNFTLVGNVQSNIFWITPRYLGSIYPGEVSTFKIEAYSIDPIEYKLTPGMPQNLPQGLMLQTTGNITGRASFNVFALDTGTTTFDADISTRLDPDANETTFNRTYIFNATAYSLDGSVNETKEFEIYLDKDSDIPYNILYGKAMPPINDRIKINTLFADTTIFDPAILYRPDDINFNVKSEIIYQHAFGLYPASLNEYIASFKLNHYRKSLVLGELKTAQALDNNGDVIYEVVYSSIIDDLVNQKGVSVSQNIDLYADAINPGDGSSLPIIINKVYPNSLYNMRNQVIDKIGQVSKQLPKWMISKQKDDSVLGFTPAWVLAYTIPDRADNLLYKINNYNIDFNTIDFTIDRFILDSLLTKDWITCDKDKIYTTADNAIITADNAIITADEIDINADCVPSWMDTISTTFDVILPLINITVDSTVITVDSNRYINYSNPGGNYIIDSETTFDGASTRFISPVSIAISTDEFDKYVMFPQVNVTDTIPIDLPDY